jgi:hypothetical protein
MTLNFLADQAANAASIGTTQIDGVKHFVYVSKLLHAHLVKVSARPVDEMSRSALR